MGGLFSSEVEEEDDYAQYQHFYDPPSGSTTRYRFSPDQQISTRPPDDDLHLLPPECFVTSGTFNHHSSLKFDDTVSC